MSDQIVQKLSFDAGDAIGAISRLNTDMKTMAERVQNLGSAFTAFNSQASATSKILSTMATDASKAADAFERLAKARGAANTATNQGGGTSGGGGGRGGKNGPDPNEVKQHIAALQQTYGAAPADASDTAQRKYQNAITQAAQFAAKSKQSVSQVAGIGQQLGSSFTGAANTMANKLSSIKQAFASMQVNASKNVNKLTIDFQTFVRIVSTQVVVRALSAIKQAFGDAFEGAMKFQTQVAEIGTISTKDFGGSEGIAKTVRSISDAFNLPLNTTAEGYYETISNQIGDAAKSQEFLGSSAKLAKAGVTSLDQAVNLLSATINSYGISTSQTDRLAAQYFETVRLGRVRVDELANTIGRVAPQASQLGIGVDEMMAAIASITISGVKPSEALTQFRGSINALAKPTDKLKAAFKELNVDSAEQAIGAYGYGGLLKKLADTTDGTSQAFAELFPNMRGVNGAIIVGKKQVEAYGESLKSIKSVGGDFIDEKAAEIMASNSQKVGKELTKLSTALTVDFGGGLVDASAKMIEWGLNADNMGTAIGIATPLIASAGAALVLYATKLAIANGATAIFAAGTLSGLNRALLAAGAVEAVAIAINKAYSDYENKPLQDTAAQGEQDVASAKRFNEAKQQSAQKTFDAIADAAKANLVKLNGVYQTNLENAKSADAKQLASTKDMLQQLVGAREKYIEALRQTAGQAHQNQVESQSRVMDTQLQREQTLFQMRTQNLDPRHAAFALRDRTSDLTSRASSLLASAAGNPQQLQQALRLFQSAESAAQEFVSKSQESGVLQRTAQEAVLTVFNKRIEAEKQLQALEARRQGAADKERIAQEKSLVDVKAAVKTVVENTGNFDKDGKLFDAKTSNLRKATRDAALGFLQKTALTSKDFSLADSLGLGKFVSEYKDKLNNVGPVKIQFDIEYGANQIQTMLKKGIKGIPGQQLLAGVSGKSVSNPSEALNVTNELVAEFQRLNEQTKEAADARSLVEADRNNLRATAKALGAYGPDKANDRDIMAPEVRELVPMFQKLLSQEHFTATDYNKAAAQYFKVRDAHTTDLGAIGRYPLRGGRPTSNVLNLSDKFLSQLETLMNHEGSQRENPAFTNPQGTEQRLQQLSTAVGASRSSVQGLGTTTSRAASQTAEGLDNVAEAAMSAAEALNNIRLPQAEEGEAHATGGLIRALTHGGMQHFATGGRARGVDNVPAMLSPGEFVMNARSTRTFYTQLAAMNAGMEPNYRQNGGAVTTIGDVHVNVNGAHAPQQTARAVAGELRRLARRGVTSR